MQKILVFSDLHANKRAAEDIKPLINKVDLSVFCGDILGYGKDIDYCIKFVLENIDLVVIGNHDRMAITNEDLEGQEPIVRESIIFTRRRLSEKDREAIAALPKEIWQNNIYVTHSIGDLYLRREEEYRKILERMRKHTEYGFFGHTHEQVCFEYRNKFIVNPGSISKGRAGRPRSYVIIDGGKIEFKCMGSII
jgi:putative phosphoesterase